MRELDLAEMEKRNEKLLDVYNESIKEGGEPYEHS